MEDLGELAAPSVQLLDLPVPQMVENVTDTLLRILDFPIAEQVIDVPKIFCSPCPSHSRVPEPQSADQLVEVPTVLSPTRIALQIAEQIVDTPVHLPESVEWVQLRDEATSRPYFWNRRTRETKWKPPPGIRVVWVGETTEGGRAPLPPGSEELNLQPRAVYKYWAPCRLYFPLRPPRFWRYTCSLFWYDSGYMTSVYRGFCGWSFLYSAQSLGSTVVARCLLGDSGYMGEAFVAMIVFSAMRGSTVALGDDFLVLVVFSALLGSTVALGVYWW